jgi:hypothetical protein
LLSHFEGGTQTEVFDNRMLKTFGPKREEDGLWRKLHNDELHSLCSSPDIITRVIKSRRLRWVGHVARTGEMFTGFLLGGTKVRVHWEDIGVGGRIILSWTLGR